MRILIISTLDLSKSNGGTAHFTSIAKEMRQAGNTVDAIIPSTGDRNKDCHIVTSGCFDKVTFSSNILSRFIPISKTSINSFNQILVIMFQKPKDYDWVYLRSNILSLFVLYSLKLRGFRKIVTEHNGWFMDELNMMGVPLWIQQIVKYLQIADAKLANLVRVVVPNIQEKLQKYGTEHKKIFVAGNATNLNLFKPINRQQALSKIDLDPNLFYLGFIGDLEPWQGVEVAINAMTKIVHVYPDTRLLIVGGGRQLNYFKETYRHLNYVRFLGSVPYTDSNDYINCFDIALLPKQGLENIGYSPIKLYAYAAAGRPIVASDIQGINDLKSSGFLVLHESGNSEDLANQIINMIIKKDHLSEMSIAARQYAEKNFSWRLVAEKIIQAMQQYDNQI